MPSTVDEGSGEAVGLAIRCARILPQPKEDSRRTGRKRKCAPNRFFETTQRWNSRLCGGYSRSIRESYLSHIWLVCEQFMNHEAVMHGLQMFCA